MAFSANHRRHLLTTFKYVDRLLGESFERLTAHEETLLFPSTVADATAQQRAAIAAALANFRVHMQAFLQAHGIREERPNLSAVWSFRTALYFAGSALDEIAPKRLAAYGPLDTADAEAAQRVMEELQALLTNLAATLDASMKEPPHA